MDKAGKRVKPRSKPGDYKLLKELGSGNFGSVHLAQRISDGRESNTLVIKHTQPRHSNGVKALINEDRQEAILLMRKELPTFCFALGTSQVLANGNTWYHCGTHDSAFGIHSLTHAHSTGYEVSPAGDIVHSMGFDGESYRAFRLKSLYGGVEYMPVDGTTSLPIPDAWAV
ncbi:hypothetical protein KIPB_005265 [Kipferlia bialata]|uniref:Protein kinase domain-containing protein n=1 Tax=Kipferlia bialata TaxID=797122 RepID=A0A9K3CV42_9EUKA|nr:hypothetical protein KIPB_003225 [Kipferlia bialata]GIQ83868.1 hypothetical protein KIPB_005265 [Kipferlia bialata]|eukprot:g3225.t1